MNKRPLVALAVTAIAATGTLTACGGSESSVASDCKPAHTFSTLSKGSLTVAAYDLPPFSKVEGKKLVGVDGDVLAAIAEKECLSLDIKPAATAAVIPNVQAGRADLAAGDWYRTKERAQIVTLSDPIYTDQMGLVSKDGTTSIEALKGVDVGTVDGYLWVDDLKKYLGSSLKVYASPLNMYQDLKAGRIQIGVDSFGSGVYNGKGFEVKVAEPLDAVKASLEGAQSCFPMVQDNAELATAINEDLAALREDGTLAKIMTDNGLDASAAEPGAGRLIG